MPARANELQRRCSRAPDRVGEDADPARLNQKSTVTNPCDGELCGFGARSNSRRPDELRLALIMRPVAGEHPLDRRAKTGRFRPRPRIAKTAIGIVMIWSVIIASLTTHRSPRLTDVITPLTLE
jgi:hypothetical protein